MRQPAKPRPTKRKSIGGLFVEHGPLIFCILFLVGTVFLNYTWDFSFQNLILEQLYQLDSSVLKRISENICKPPAAAPTPGATPPIPAPGCPELPYLVIGSKLSSNTLILKILNMLLICACVLAVFQYVRIICSHRAGLRSTLVLAFLLFLWFFVHASGIVWHLVQRPAVEGHFARISVSLPLGAIEFFCQSPFAPSLPPDHVAKADKLKSDNPGRFDERLVTPHLYCPEGHKFVRNLFYVSLVFALMVLGFGMAAGALGFNPLTTPSHHQLKRRYKAKHPITELTDVLVEYRKRADDNRTFLYYSSFVLVLAIAWMATHAKWAFPLVTSAWGNEAVAIVNGYVTYVATMYLLFVLGVFIPLTLFLQSSLRAFYYATAGADGADDTFREWLDKNKVDVSVAGARDLLAFAAPMASLLISGLFESASIKDIVGAAMK